MPVGASIVKPSTALLTAPIHVVRMGINCANDGLACISNYVVHFAVNVAAS